MNRAEAFKILELSPNATEEEAKKQFRKLAAKYHPDTNKDPDALEKSKQISAAWNYLKDNFNEKPVGDPWDFFKNSGKHVKFPFDPFNGFNAVQRKPRVHLSTSLSFEESVLGCQRTFQFSRFIKCNTCNGLTVKLVNVCTTCKGQGYNEFKTANVTVNSTCRDCHGTGQDQELCTDCSQTGGSFQNASIDVKIAGGILHGQVVRLPAGGHFVVGMGGYDDAYVTVEVTSDADMSLKGMNVISNISISLLDALRGVSKEIRTVLGPKTIDIPSGSRHKDEIVVPNHGVNQQGNHIVKIEVIYPNDKGALIDALLEIEKN